MSLLNSVTSTDTDCNKQVNYGRRVTNDMMKNACKVNSDIDSGMHYLTVDIIKIYVTQSKLSFHSTSRPTVIHKKDSRI